MTVGDPRNTIENAGVDTAIGTVHSDDRREGAARCWKRHGTSQRERSGHTGYDVRDAHSQRATCSCARDARKNHCGIYRRLETDFIILDLSFDFRAPMTPIA